MKGTSTMYKTRRNKIIQAMPKHSALIIPSWPQTNRSADIEWPYRPDSNLLYFSGFEEANSCLLILSQPQEKYFLFTQKKDPAREIWTGPIHGPEQASDIYQMHSSYCTSDFIHIAPEIFNEVKSLYYNFGINLSWDVKIKNLIHTLKNKHKSRISLHDPIHIISGLRMQKKPEEIQFIKKAVEISSYAHIKVMKHCKPGMNERELHGVFLSESMKRGSNAESYPGIFAGADRACTLHYINNNQILKDGDCILVDAGAEYNYYSSDITRSFPVNGKFSKAQKRIYTKLLKTQKEMISFLKPRVLFSDIQKKLVELLSIVMREENILSDSVENIIKKKQYLKYFPHSFGHLLGLDVHDITFSETKNLQLKQNFVLTMEPGLYLPLNDLSLDPELRGMGFRIEDDILITKNGAEVLSHLVPKEIENIENLMNQN